ncbi:hypothetical protein AAFF_G00189000 [Aldrovandia affinis]|uniref:Uncharacterized protein n=1 Tax=Aldrovandia affinis TaxID=143900 RepID=A0AAD7RJF1_9TELE|nr:hypothetical protein AAFF_G00189000 [Aldrovandia affinis]
MICSHPLLTDHMAQVPHFWLEQYARLGLQLESMLRDIVQPAPKSGMVSQERSSPEHSEVTWIHSLPSRNPAVLAADLAACHAVRCAAWNPLYKAPPTLLAECHLWTQTASPNPGKLSTGCFGSVWLKEFIKGRGVSHCRHLPLQPEVNQWQKYTRETA